jgi:hypothetical protein
MAPLERITIIEWKDVNIKLLASTEAYQFNNLATQQPRTFIRRFFDPHSEQSFQSPAMHPTNFSLSA